MEANYRIVKIGKKYFPQARFKHIVTSGHGDIQPIFDWIYFKDHKGEDLHFKTYDEALAACIESDMTEMFEEITNIEIINGKVIKEQKIR